VSRPPRNLVANPNLTIDVTIDEPIPPLHLLLRDEEGDDSLSRFVRLMIAVVENVIRGFEETLD